MSILKLDDYAFDEPQISKIKFNSATRKFDDSIGDRVLQVSATNPEKWVEVSETIFRSWTGFRRINGEDYHGPVYVFRQSDETIYQGARSCGCNVCQENVSAALKVN